MLTKLNFGRSSVVSLLTGAIFGFSFASLLYHSTYYYWEWTVPTTDDFANYLGRISLSEKETPEQTHNTAQHEHYGSEDTVARELSEKVRILCWVMTQPASHQKKAVHVKNTWGRRCNVLLFMSSQADYSLPAIRLKVNEGRDNLWGKTKESFKYVHQHYMDRFDWVLKADDDTYVIIENLRYLLSRHNSTDKLYLGCHFKQIVKQGYMSGGAGYVLSKEAVRAFVEEALPNQSCRQDNRGAEDAEMGKCLEQLGVSIVDSRDSFGRHRFFPLPPRSHLAPQPIPSSHWFWQYIKYPVKEGFECCSDTSISFHYISPDDMYVFEFLIYHVKPYGIDHNILDAPSKPSYYNDFNDLPSTEQISELGITNEDTDLQIEDNSTKKTIL